MENFLENILERELEISKTYKIKQDQRNAINNEFQQAIMNWLEESGLDYAIVDKAIAVKIDNIATRTPNGYIPIKIAVSIPSVDFDIDFEHNALMADKLEKEREKKRKKELAEKKKLRDAQEREMKKLAKQKLIEKNQNEKAE